MVCVYVCESLIFQSISYVLRHKSECDRAFRYASEDRDFEATLKFDSYYLMALSHCAKIC